MSCGKRRSDMFQNLREQAYDRLSADVSPERRMVELITLTLAVGVAYFLAQLSQLGEKSK
jgi:hypothetical protein